MSSYGLGGLDANSGQTIPMSEPGYLRSGGGAGFGLAGKVAALQLRGRLASTFDVGGREDEQA
jgi:hypothetical protein